MRFPDINENNGTKTYLNIPAADGVKAANASATFGFWMRQSDSRYAATIDRHVMGVSTIATGLYINLRPNLADYSNPDRLEIIARTSWTTHINGTVDIPGPHMGSPMLVMVIVNPTYYHLVCAKPGGTVNVTSVASAAPYGASWTSGGPFVQRPGFAFAGGHIEEMFFIDGEFPETTGVPDATLIANIADGSQDLDTLHTQFTGGAQRFRYKMQGPFDVSDDWALAGDMTWTGKTAATGHFATPSGPLRPQALMPTWSNNRVSQVTFATAGTMTGATANIKIEGGTYSGITPSAIQAKLVDENGTTVKDWTEIDGAPGGGTWTGGTLTNVPATAGYLYAQIRAVDGGGSQIGDFVYSAGCRGTGLCIVGQSQSQGSLPATASGTTLPSGLRYMHGEVDDGAYVGSPMKHYLVGSGEDATGRFAGMGAGQAALEWNAVFPGYPVEITWVGRGGTALSSYANGGANDFVWERLASHLGGAMNDHLLLMYGHSSTTDQNPATYQTEIGQVITEHDAHVGAAVKVIHMPTSRYAQSGTDSNHANCKAARDGARLYCAANPATTWLGTTTYHDQKEAGDLGPHSDLTDKGHRRVGAAWAWNAMSCIDAVEDKPLKLGAATLVSGGTAVELTLEPVNAAASGETITGTAFTDPDAFGAGTVAPGAVAVTGAAHSDADAFGAGTLTTSATITGTLHANAHSFGAGTVAPGAVALTGSAHVSPNLFGAGTLVAGPVTITGMLHVNTSAIGSGILSTGGLAIAGAAFTDPDAFGAGQILTGGVTITGALYASPDVIGAGTIAPGPVAILGLAHSDGDTFGAGAVAPGAVTLTGLAHTDPDAFGAGTIAAAGPGAQVITGAAHAESDTFGAGTVAPQPVAVIGTAYLDPDAFGAGTVAPGGVVIIGTALVSPDVFTSGTIAPGAVTILGAHVLDPDAFGAGTIVAPGSFTRPARRAGNTRSRTSGPRNLSSVGIPA